MILKALSNSNMTPMGRVVIVKTFIMSQLVYLLSNLPSPSKGFLDKIDKFIFNFIITVKLLFADTPLRRTQFWSVDVFPINYMIFME